MVGEVKKILRKLSAILLPFLLWYLHFYFHCDQLGVDPIFGVLALKITEQPNNGLQTDYF